MVSFLVKRVAGIMLTITASILAGQGVAVRMASKRMEVPGSFARLPGDTRW